MEFFDSHAHLTGEGDYDSLDEIIKRAKKQMSQKL